MEKLEFFALSFKGGLLEITEAEAAAFPAEIIKKWTLEHDPYTAKVALAVGKRMADEKIGLQFGTDGETVAIAKGQFIAEKIVKAWDRKIDDGTLLPINADNIETLPLFILKKLPSLVSGGVYATDAEIEALKISGPTPPSSSSTGAEGG